MKNKRRIFAILAIFFLLALYLFNLILALIGTEFTRKLLMATLPLGIAIPILLYGALVIMQKNPSLHPQPEEELNQEEKEEIYRLLEEKQKKEQERKKAGKDS